MNSNEILSSREQAYNRLTLAAGFLIMSGASVFVAFEGKPIPAGLVAIATGSASVILGKVGAAELRESYTRPEELQNPND